MTVEAGVTQIQVENSEELPRGSQEQANEPQENARATPGKYVVYGRRFRELRHAAGLSLGVLARQTELSVATISKLQNGHMLPSKETKLALAGVLGHQQIEAINWPRAKSPLSYNHQPSSSLSPSSSSSSSPSSPSTSKQAIPVTRLERMGEQLRHYRLHGMAEPLDQFEMASRLGLKEAAYRNLEQGGSKRWWPQVLQKLTELENGDQVVSQLLETKS